MAANFFKGVAEFFTPVLAQSHFQEKGVLTPDEFVQAGDLLVTKCPSWSWASGESDKQREFLPKEKQFLITKGVPCARRAKALEEEANMDVEHDLGDGWIETNANKDEEEIGEIKDDQDKTEKQNTSNNNDSEPVINKDDEDGDNEDGDIPDMDDLEDDGIVEDEATLSVSNQNTETNDGDGFVKTRSYDLSITYDKYYQTPRIWLSGRDENGDPLSSNQILEDIYADYANKTVTIEKHPHLKMTTASIHPCRHASVMKKMVDRLADSGKYVRVDLYMFLFLKFMSAVIPTIEYDTTINA
eukprot:gb/GECH01002910.1/.p1 GENE.gb/GECH01002910.1/~~gb/GECH01002910.1/.p1  ORF type:complete len:300 (+),score=106.40 gb/GECH01002910.1/:1-900(+)